MSGKFCGGFGAALGTWLYTTSCFISYLCAEAAARGSRVHNSSDARTRTRDATHLRLVLFGPTYLAAPYIHSSARDLPTYPKLSKYGGYKFYLSSSQALAGDLPTYPTPE